MTHLLEIASLLTVLWTTCFFIVWAWGKIKGYE